MLTHLPNKNGHMNQVRRCQESAGLNSESFLSVLQSSDQKNLTGLLLGKTLYLPPERRMSAETDDI